MVNITKLFQQNIFSILNQNISFFFLFFEVELLSYKTCNPINEILTKMSRCVFCISSATVVTSFKKKKAIKAATVKHPL